MTGNSSARRQLEEETETEKESIRKCKQEKKSNQIKEKEVRGKSEVRDLEVSWNGGRMEETILFFFFFFLFC